MKAEFSRHISNDWCHLCGVRSDQTVDVFYPKNAENDTERNQYIRICVECAQRIIRVESVDL